MNGTAMCLATLATKLKSAKLSPVADVAKTTPKETNTPLYTVLNGVFCIYRTEIGVWRIALGAIQINCPST